jgi:hypothetical protein
MRQKTIVWDSTCITNKGCVLNHNNIVNFEILDKLNHNRSHFDCGVLELNEYILKYANQQQGKHLNTVYVAVRKNYSLPKPILGYYTLSASSLSFQAVSSDIGKKIPKNYPVSTIKIGRLARDLRETKPGFGEKILGDALYRILRLSKELGVFAVDVDAKNHRAKRFYQKYGFCELQDNPMGLIMPIKTLEKVFSTNMSCSKQHNEFILV